MPHREGPPGCCVMMMGVPNVGKSTLVNALLNWRIANAGDEPAVIKLALRLAGWDLAIRHAGADVAEDRSWRRWFAAGSNHLVGVNAYIDEEVATYLAGILLGVTAIARC